MSGNGKGPIPFQAPAAGVPIIGQPFQVSSAYVPVNMTLTCSCSQGAAPLNILLSVAVACPLCRKTYNAAFNPGTGKIDMLIGLPPEGQVAS